ncbi:MAG TPA: BspA family leucine-rich repeat surface protein [Clostridiaceae bacterium]|nr:BspA family leucine-rich repeat surface protein [Clostridiaceae bacterium]
MKNNKGITLIALVITIIVMLILVGVTVSAAINGKLFDTAKKAAKDTENAKQEEIEYIKNVEDKIDEILGVTTSDKVEDIISKPVEGETEVYAIIFSDGTMELRKEKPTETENVVFKTDESFSNKLFKNKKEIPWISYVDSIKEVKIADEIVPRTTARWFQGLKNLTTISNIENLKTDKVVSMESMFSGCTSLEAVDVSGFNTQEVINMCAMFQNCSKIKSLAVNNWNTSKVIDMSYMFNKCSALTNIDVSKFNTQEVINMCAMFQNCSTIKSLAVNNWNTSKVINMSYMFFYVVH